MRWVAPTEKVTVNEAMADIEKHNPKLGGVLPRDYQIFNGTLLKELLKKVSEIPVSLDYHAFGRIDEYFLGQSIRRPRRALTRMRRASEELLIKVGCRSNLAAKRSS